MISNNVFWVGFLFGAFFIGVGCMAIGLFAILDGRKKRHIDISSFNKYGHLMKENERLKDELHELKSWL